MSEVNTVAVRIGFHSQQNDKPEIEQNKRAEQVTVKLDSHEANSEDVERRHLEPVSESTRSFLFVDELFVISNLLDVVTVVLSRSNYHLL